MKNILTWVALSTCIFVNNAFASNITCRLRVRHTLPNGTLVEPVVQEEFDPDQNGQGGYGITLIGIRGFVWLSSDKSTVTSVSVTDGNVSTKTDAAMTASAPNFQGRIFTVLDSKLPDGTTLSGQLGCYKP